MIAVDEGGPATLVRDGATGLLRPSDPDALGAAVAGLAADQRTRERCARAGLAAVADRTWDRALARLAAGYRTALGTGAELRRGATCGVTATTRSPSRSTTSSPRRTRARRSIRDWLDDHGIDRVTLLVVPAPDLHPFSTSSPELAEWLLERADRGDAIAQHGLTCREHGVRTAGPGGGAPRRRLRAAPPEARGRRAARVRGAGLRVHARAARHRARALRLVGRPHAAAPRRGPRSQSRPPSGCRRWRCAPARCWAARSCASTCARPTSTTRATCSRSSACCAARGDGGVRRRLAVT